MDKVTAALLLIVAVHLVAVVVLFWALVDGDTGWRGWWPGGGGGDDGHGPGEPRPTAPRGGDRLPLPDAAPAGVRLRDEHERLADVRRRERRPAREPERAPVSRPS